MKSNIFSGIDPATHCGGLSYTIHALARVGRLALENDTSGEDRESVMFAVAELLEVVGAMSNVVIDGVEQYERRLRCGLWADPVEEVANSLDDVNLPPDGRMEGAQV